MPIHRLSISNFRNLLQIDLQPSPVFNVFHGNNGSGKTSILEAIFYLSLARSFRTYKTDRIIHHQAEKFSIFSQIESSSQTISMGIERVQNGDLKIRISGQDAKNRAELANLLPVQLINSNCFQLLEGGPNFRRKYLDWGAFYHQPGFFQAWQHYFRALKQRNTALREHSPRPIIDAWSQNLAEQAEQLHTFRKTYAGLLIPALTEILMELIYIPDLTISYFPGWDINKNLMDVFDACYEKDLSFGHTQQGAHRADLKITINGIPAKEILSRGQQKLFICAMIATQGILLKKCVNMKPIYLVDDLPAELDMNSRAHLMKLLSKQNAQVFITTVDAGIISEIDTQTKLFHVEHGCIRDDRP